MKSTLWNSRFVLALTLMVGLIACEKSSVLDDFATPSGLTAEQLAALPFPEGELLTNPALQEATETQELAILSDGVADFEQGRGYAFRDSSGQVHGMWGCLDSLQLTQGQKDSIRQVTGNFMACRAYHIREIRQINQTIISGANLQRQQLIQQYRNGQITQAQLKTALRQLMIQTRYQLRNNPAKQQQMAQLRSCYDRYLRAMHQILTPTQWQQFRDCFLAIRPR